VDIPPLPTPTRQTDGAGPGGQRAQTGTHTERVSARLILLALSCAAAFAALTALVATGTLDAADRTIRGHLLADPGTPAAWAAIGLAWAGSAPVVALTGAALVALRFPDRKARAIAAWLAVLAAAAAVEWIVKPLLARPRPDGIVGALASARLGGGGGGSFPSGHALTAALLAVLTWQLWRGFGPRAVAVAWVLAVGLSRLALGVHWPTDVVAGVIAGIGLGLVLAILLPPAPPGTARRRRPAETSEGGVPHPDASAPQDAGRSTPRG